MGHLRGIAVKHLPSAQGVIWRYGIEPHIRLLCHEPASTSPSPPACVPPLTGCLYLCRINNKIFKKKDRRGYIDSLLIEVVGISEVTGVSVLLTEKMRAIMARDLAVHGMKGQWMPSPPW